MRTNGVQLYRGKSYIIIKIISKQDFINYQKNNEKPLNNWKINTEYYLTILYTTGERDIAILKFQFQKTVHYFQ